MCGITGEHNEITQEEITIHDKEDTSVCGGVPECDICNLHLHNSGLCEGLLYPCPVCREVEGENSGN